MIVFQIKRILEIKGFARFCVLTSQQGSDDELCDILNQFKVDYFRADLEDVNLRFRKALYAFGANSGYFIRLTADCPLICPELIEIGIQKTLSGSYDYFSNTVVRSFPDGLDFEIVSVESFLELANKELDSYDREHVTPFIYRNSQEYKIGQLVSEVDFSKLRLTVDYPEDLDFIREIVDSDSFNPMNMSYSHLLELYFQVNKHLESDSITRAFRYDVQRIGVVDENQ